MNPAWLKSLPAKMVAADELPEVRLRKFFRAMIENPPQLDYAKWDAHMNRMWPQIMKTNRFLGLPVYPRINLGDLHRSMEKRKKK